MCSGPGYSYTKIAGADWFSTPHEGPVVPEPCPAFFKKQNILLLSARCLNVSAMTGNELWSLFRRYIRQWFQI
jgi:hypothetical protein